MLIPLAEFALSWTFSSSYKTQAQAINYRGLPDSSFSEVLQGQGGNERKLTRRRIEHPAIIIIIIIIIIITCMDYLAR